MSLSAALAASETVEFSEAIDEVREHSLKLDGLSADTTVLGVRDEAEIVDQEQAVLKLGRRSHGQVKEPDELPVPRATVAAAAAFRDVGANGRSSAAELSSETESLIVGKGRGQAVYCEGQLVRALPDLELVKTFHGDCTSVEMLGE